ncbi:MAG: LON peptidase substrate-binding domain-containing protein, partial [Spirochaetota bacterium]|nr:LON peptidase substrate-binding domain-containing protein [Spirochaetota bacterium]
MKISSLTKGAKKSLPLVPLRELVVFPHMVIPFFAGNAESIKAIEESMTGDRLVFLVCQKNETESPGKDDIYQSGTVSKVLQMLKLPDGTIRVLAEGRQRGIIKRYEEKDQMRRVLVHPLEDTRSHDSELEPLIAAVVQAFEKYAKLQKKVPQEIIETIQKTELPDKLVDLICANTTLAPEKKVEILSIVNTRERLETLAVILEAENEVISLQNKINVRVKKKLERNQKEYYLNEQIRQINKELGRDEDDASGANELRERIKAKNP